MIDRQQIRDAQEQELPLIRKVHIEAFGGNTQEAKLVELLHAARKAKPSLVAIANGRIVGHVVFSPVTVESALANTRVVGLGPIGVLPAFQRNGIGSRLIEAGLEACLADGVDAVVVLGSPRFYSRFGFLPAMDHGLSNQYVTDGHFMIRELRGDILATLERVMHFGSNWRVLRA